MTNEFERIFSMLYMMRTEYQQAIFYGKMKLKKHKELGLLGRDGKKTKEQLAKLKHLGELSKDGKNTKTELALQGEIAAHQFFNNEINRLHLLTDRVHQVSIETMMSEERIKDLHAFLDTILMVKNIDVVMEIIKIGLDNHEKEEKRVVCPLSVIEKILNTHCIPTIREQYREQLGYTLSDFEQSKSK